MSGAAVVVASSNPGKVREIAAILSASRFAWRSLADLPPVEFPEEGGDYAANAVAKARAVAGQLGCFAVGDDSGLEVDALQGGPGAFSARFGGPGLDDTERLHAVREALEGVEPGARGARFVCVAALATPSGATVHFRGECRGRILTAPRGKEGFGYDPIFQLLGREETMAELSVGEKNRISHRARAFLQLSPELERRLAEA